MSDGIYGKIEQAILFIDRHKTDQLSLREIASSAGMSEFHFHRLFTEWAGTTPERFFRFLKKEYILKELSSMTLTDLTYKAGLSNPSRLHDLLVTYEAVTPGQMKEQGRDLTVYYGSHPTPFGNAFIALTDKGILELQFEPENGGNYARILEEEFPLARFVKDPSRTGNTISILFDGREPAAGRSFHLLLKGTNFQIKVWEALLRIPFGRLIDYGRVARLLGQPKASRAVGSAIGRNTIAFLIPCHRVINKLGDTGNYRWGPGRKKALIGWEQAREAGSLTGQADIP
jgi:AraC family transcriptional regulator, regulatory protein of adaptative response / methylated-DNA-[protein]-cysteine methyltransferase